MRVGILVLVAGTLLQPVSLRAADRPPDWWLAQREATAALMQPGTELAALAKQVSQTPPANGQEAMFALSILARAGAQSEAVQAARHLKRLCPKLDDYQVSSIYHDACDRYQAWGAAQTVVELYADNVSGLSLDSRLLKHFMDSGWTVEQVDRWLRARPKGTNHFWVKERLHFNAQHGRGEALVKKLVKRVRANPRDVDACVGFLSALVHTRTSRDKEPDLAWIAEAIQPKQYTDAAAIAGHLATLENWEGAAKLYRQATTIPITHEDLRHIPGPQMYVPNAAVRAGLAAQTRERLATCLQKMGKEEEAQKWVREAQEIRKGINLERKPRFVPDSQPTAQQAPATRDPRYWCDRAQYYHDRKETALEEEALVKGLALAPPRPGPIRGKGLEIRSRLLRDYAQFLTRQKRPDQAIALLRRELTESPADSCSCTAAAGMLARDFRKRLKTDDAVLWTWLGNRPRWEYAEEHLLQKMLRSANRDDIEMYLVRAEKLAAGNDPSRACALGSIEKQMDFQERALPLFVYAVEKSQNKEIWGRAACSLVQSYLAAGDWRRAEQVFPAAAQRLSPAEVTEWYSRIAVRAAKAGAKADAMRIWGRVANVDLSATDALEKLVEVGLRDELIAFYRDAQKQTPSSTIPPAVLARLGARAANK